MNNTKRMSIMPINTNGTPSQVKHINGVSSNNGGGVSGVEIC
jgi:hypothetical protein